MPAMTQISRRGFVQGVVGAAGLAALSRVAGGATSRPSAPNILLLSADDLNPHLGCYGNKVVQSPNIDRLAAEGTRFGRCYAQYPSCLPSRASFLSGWHPQRTGTLDFSAKPRDGRLRDVVYLGQHFRNNGYRSMRLDKVFHVGADDTVSWDISEEPEPGKPPVYLANELKELKLTGRVVREGRYDHINGERGPYYVMDVEDHELYDGMTTTRAINLMKETRAGGKPMFLAVGYRRPHLPWIAPRKYFDMYPPRDIPLPPPHPGDAQRIPEKDHRELIAHYYACISYIDAQIGRLLRGLEEAQLADSTIVVLLGDQGYCLGERGMMFGKGTLWERSVHVPLIIRAPGARPRVCNRITSLIDIYPTLCDLANLQAPRSQLQGASLAPFVRGEEVTWTDESFAIWKPHKGPVEVAVRTDRYRYIESTDRQPIELVDCAEDPFEHRNLVSDPALSAVRAELAERVRRDRS